MKVPFSKIVIGDLERKYVQEVLDSGWLTTASKTLEFERKFADYIGVKYACAVNSCTSALHLGIDALGIKAGDKVIVPSMTFTASAEVVRYMNADIIPIDVEYGTNLLTPEILRDALEKHPDVKLVIVVHYGGQSAEIDTINEICRERNIKILEDAAHAFPTRYKNKYVGSFGNVTCFSFYANKTITTGEGGMLVTDDINIYNRVKTMRLHGINRDIWDRFTSDKPSWEYDVIDAGYKYNMPDLCAAIGLGQLSVAEELRAKREKIVDVYYDKLADLSMISLPICKVAREDHAWHIFPIIMKDSARITRNEFIEKLSELGVGTSVHYKPLHRLKYYREKYDLNESDYPIADETWIGTVSLPLYSEMTLDEVDYVVDVVRRILLK